MNFARLFRKRTTKPAAPETIEAAEFHIVCVHWKGTPCFVKVRELSDIQIQSIGNFSLIERDGYKWSKAAKDVKVPWGELLSYANQNVKICKAALVSPSYDEIFNIVGKHEFNDKVREDVKNINEILKTMQDGPARQELEAVRDSLIMAWEVILPNDFMAEVVGYALKLDRSDIKKVTEEMLYNAAILAERGSKAPHEYIHGLFDEFNIRDIDTNAWIIHSERMEALRAQRKTRKG